MQLLHEAHLFGHRLGHDELLVLAKLEQANTLQLLDGAVGILLHLELGLDLLRQRHVPLLLLQLLFLLLHLLELVQLLGHLHLLPLGLLLLHVDF